MEEARKSLKNRNLLQIKREEQITEKRIIQSLEIKRDKEQFEKIIEGIEQAIKSDKEEKERKLKKTLVYREELLKQVILSIS